MAASDKKGTLIHSLIISHSQHIENTHYLFQAVRDLPSHSYCSASHDMEYTKHKENTVRRGAKKAHYDRHTIHSILDANDICHVAFVVDGKPFVQPINYGRSGDTLFLHGSPKNRMTKSLIDAGEATLSVAVLDAMKLTKSAYNHSVNFRSVVVFGKVRERTTDEEKLEALEVIINHFVPERWEHCRKPTREELMATRVIEVKIETASAKVADTPPADKEEDVDLDYWAGTIPVKTVFGPPVTVDESEKQSSIPDHILKFCENPKKG